MGGVIAARLTRAHHDVTPIVGNPRIEAALLQDGFQLLDFNGSVERIPLAEPPVRNAVDARGVFI